MKFIYVYVYQSNTFFKNEMTIVFILFKTIYIEIKQLIG